MIIIYSLICQMIAGLYFIFGGLLGLVFALQGISPKYANPNKGNDDFQIKFFLEDVFFYPLIIEPLLDGSRL